MSSRTNAVGYNHSGPSRVTINLCSREYTKANQEKQDCSQYTHIYCTRWPESSSENVRARCKTEKPFSGRNKERTAFWLQTIQ